MVRDDRTLKVKARAGMIVAGPRYVRGGGLKPGGGGGGTKPWGGGGTPVASAAWTGAGASTGAGAGGADGALFLAATTTPTRRAGRATIGDLAGQDLRAETRAGAAAATPPKATT